MDNRKLMALAESLRHKTAQQVDNELHRRHLDVETRLAVKC